MRADPVKTLIAILALACLASGAYAQATCPVVALRGPSGPIKAGETIRFTAAVKGGDPNLDLRYEWSVSATGRQVSVKKRKTLKINTTGITADSVTATLVLIDSDQKCRVSSSFTVAIEQPAASVLSPRFDGVYSLRSSNPAHSPSFREPELISYVRPWSA